MVEESISFPYERFLLLYWFYMVKQTVLIQIFVTPALARRLKKRAKLETMSMTGWVRQVVTFALDKPSRRELDTPSPREQAGREMPANQA